MIKLFAFFLFLVANSIQAAELPEDFWEKCPGPACPSNKPEFQDINPGTEIRTEELIRKERELLEREKNLLERELRFREQQL